MSDGILSLIPLAIGVSITHAILEHDKIHAGEPRAKRAAHIKHLRRMHKKLHQKRLNK